MNGVQLIIGSLGSGTAFLAGVAVFSRAILRNVSATRDNTRVMKELTGQVNLMRSEFDDLRIRVAIIEDRQRRR